MTNELRGCFIRLEVTFDRGYVFQMTLRGFDQKRIRLENVYKEPPSLDQIQSLINETFELSKEHIK